MASKSPRNFIGEWFGHRVFPKLKAGAIDIKDFKSGQCPFLSDVTRRATHCVKNKNSIGVCTITTTKDRPKDWMVCPYRSLDIDFLQEVVSCLFSDNNRIALYPVTALTDSIDDIIKDYSRGNSLYVFFKINSAEKSTFRQQISLRNYRST